MQLHSKKYDGSLHYHYPVQLIERTPDRLITHCAPGAPMRSYRGSWPAKAHLLSIFQLNRPYVLHAKWDPDWRPRFLYVDIAIHTQWTDQTVGYIDMDLDLIQPHDAEEIVLDDEDEFAEHCQQFAYPDALVSDCQAAVAEVRQLLASQHPPFTRKLFAWRPGEPVPV